MKVVFKFKREVFEFMRMNTSDFPEPPQEEEPSPDAAAKKQKKVKYSPLIPTGYPMRMELRA